MSILIKGIDMPKSCVRYDDDFIITECEFMRDDWSCIFQTDCKPFPDEEEFKEQYNNCPLISIPTPHGRLIDADEFKSWLDYWHDCTDIGNIVESWIDERPTILEAEE